MLKVGLTGGIGSGKSYCANFFRLLGIPIYESDSKAKDLMVHNAEVIDAITDLFGRNAYHDDGSLNRAYLAKGIFSNPSLRQQINDIVHPAVAHDFTTWFSLQSDIPYVLQESALLIEIGAIDRFDKMIVVDAHLDVRIQRIMERDKATAHHVRERIQSQLQASEKLRHADFVISNDGRGVIRQVLDIHLELSKHVQKADR